MAVDPDQLAELEEERRFLLRSIEDLEREHAAGDIDDHDFTVIRDGYTARAATVLRALEAHEAVRRVRPPRRWGVVAAWVVGVVAVAALSGWLVARSSGQRAPGQPITGGQPIDEVNRKLAEARAVFSSDPTTALVLYQEVLAIEPGHPEARTYLAWLLAQSSRGASDAAQAGLAAARDVLSDVTVESPDYTDAHCFLAVVAGRFVQPPDVELALREGEICMSSDPTGFTSQLVGPLVEELRGGPGSSAPGAAEPVPASEPAVTSAG